MQYKSKLTSPAALKVRKFRTVTERSVERKTAGKISGEEDSQIHIRKRHGDTERHRETPRDTERHRETQIEADGDKERQMKIKRDRERQRETIAAAGM